MWVYLYPNNTETEISNAYIGIPSPESITLDKNSISLTTIWQTEQLTATFTPDVCDKSVTWSSDDTTVATVSTSWLVTCVTPWTCTITATTVNGLTASCSVAEWRLPSIYQEVEYIENSSSWPWIDLWHKPTDQTMSQIKFRNLVSTWYVDFGFYAWNDSADYRLFNLWTNIWWDIKSSRLRWGTLAQNVDYEWELWNNYVKDLVTSSNLLSGSTVSSYTATYNMTLNHSYVDGQNSCNRWYYVKIYENNVLIRDMIPCYRKNDTEIWMYDAENGVFYTNSWSWAFTKWPDI